MHKREQVKIRRKSGNKSLSKFGNTMKCLNLQCKKENLLTIM